MKPILETGDNVVLACGNKAIRPDSMYAVWSNQSLKIKYLQRSKNKLYLVPNNRNVPIEEVDLKNEADPVLGEVVGVCKTFRKRK
jgi:phage repressor protein C with HTH and peptisase S24 domain